MDSYSAASNRQHPHHSSSGSPIICGLPSTKWSNDQELLDRAVQSAKSSSSAIVVIGTTAFDETEGRDSDSMELDSRAVELARAVTMANPKTIVCINTGSPRDVTPFLNDAAAVLAVWFGGQEAAEGLASVLVCDDQWGWGPCGRLPTTWPMSGRCSHQHIIHEISR